MEFKKQVKWLLLFLSVLTTSGEAQQSQNTTLAVLDFSAKSVSSYLAAQVSTRLRTEIYNTGQFSVMEWERMMQILSAKSLQYHKDAAGNWMLLLGRTMGVSRIIGGSIGKIGDTYLLRADYADVETGYILKSYSEDYVGTEIELLNDLIPSIARQIADYEVFGDDSKKGVFSVSANYMPKVFLRSQPNRLKVNDVKQMIRKKDFFDNGWNKNGKGLTNQFESRILDGNRVIIDYTFGLMWQRSGSPQYLDYYAVREWIEQLNEQNFAGFSDWRLPTLEEAMSLLDSEMRSGKLYINNLFDRTQGWIWTSDLGNQKYQAWIVIFFRGYCDRSAFSRMRYVRAVRSIYVPEKVMQNRTSKSPG